MKYKTLRERIEEQQVSHNDLSQKEIDKNLQKHLLKSYQYVIIYPNGIELILILAEGEV